MQHLSSHILDVSAPIMFPLKDDVEMARWGLTKPCEGPVGEFACPAEIQHVVVRSLLRFHPTDCIQDADTFRAQLLRPIWNE